jgi:transcriptional regulator with XRE-family HTH domain
MGRKTAAPLPAIVRVLGELGTNLKLARQRRKLTAELVAERAGMSRPTLRAIERGDAGVTLGAIASVLHTLGLEQDLARVGRDDVLGRKLADAQLEAQTRVDGPRTRRDDD